MKKIILIAIGLVWGTSLFAQTDTTKIKIGETKIVILKDNNSDDEPVTHTVKKGETLYSISKQHNVSAKELQKNNSSLTKGLKVGMVLKISNNKPVTNDRFNHTVKKGETLYSISKQHNISIKELLENNPSVEEKFEAGMILKIPKNNTSTKTEIISKNDKVAKEEKFKKMEQGLIEFEKTLKEKEKELKKHELVLDSLLEQLAIKSDDDLKKKEEILIRQENRKIEDINKEIAALENGVDDIEDQLDDLDELEIDDWDFENEWPHSKKHHTHHKKEKNFRGHWAGFEVGLNNYVNDEYSILLEGSDKLFELDQDISWTVSLNFIEYNIPFGKGVGLTTGMGATWNNYHYRNNVNVYENTQGIITAELDAINEYSKNSLNMWYLTVPLLFEFQIPISKKRPGVHVGAGVVGSVKLHSERKTKYSDNISEHKIIKKTDFQIPSLKYGLTFRIGYEFINLFANYDLVPLFKKDRGPEVFPFSVGIVLLDF